MIEKDVTIIDADGTVTASIQIVPGFKDWGDREGIALIRGEYYRVAFNGDQWWVVELVNLKDTARRLEGVVYGYLQTLNILSSTPPHAPKTVIEDRTNQVTMLLHQLRQSSFESTAAALYPLNS